MAIFLTLYLVILIKISIFFFLLLSLNSCANNKMIVYDKDAGKFVLIEKKKVEQKKVFYNSNGFALIYDENFYKDKVVSKKINNDEIMVMHNTLKKNTPVKIINPENSNKRNLWICSDSLSLFSFS